MAIVEKKDVWSTKIHKAVTVYTVRSKKEMDSLTRVFRGQRYNIVTFCNDFRELERPEHFIIIERK